MVDKDMLAGALQYFDWRVLPITFAVCMTLFLVLEFAL